MTKRTKLFCIISLLTLAITIQGCGGGGGSSTGDQGANRAISEGQTAVESTPYQLSGAAVKGPLAYARITFYSADLKSPTLYNAKKPLASTTTDLFGRLSKYKLTGNAKPPFIVVVDGSTAIDLNSGTTPIIPTLVSLVDKETLSSSAGFIATPLTTLAYEMTVLRAANSDENFDIQAAMYESAKTVASVFGFGMNASVDILTSPAVVDATQNDAATTQLLMQHRAAIEGFAAITQLLSTSSNRSTSEIIKQLSLDLGSDGVIDNKNGATTVGDLNLAMITTDPANLLVPGTETPITQIASIVEHEASLMGLNQNIVVESDTLTLAVVTLSADEDGDGILNVDEQSTNPNRTDTSITSPTQDSEIGLVPRANWSVHYVSSEETVGAMRPADNAIDGDPATFWITEWFNQDVPYPHEIQINLGGDYEIDGLVYLPRQSLSDGRIDRFEIYTSLDGTTWGNPVASGQFLNDPREQKVPFAKTAAHYVKLKALSEVEGRHFAAAAELKVSGNSTPITVTAPIVDSTPPSDTQPSPVREVTKTLSVLPVLDRTGWSIPYVSSEEVNGANRPAAAAIDGDLATFWLTEWYLTKQPFPHEIHIDLGATALLKGLRYMPRQSCKCGWIGNFEIYLSEDGNNWGSPIATGTFLNDPAEQEVVFPETEARYIRLRALDELFGYHYAAVADLNLLGTTSTDASNPEPTAPISSTTSSSSTTTTTTTTTTTKATTTTTASSTTTTKSSTTTTSTTIKPTTTTTTTTTAPSSNFTQVILDEPGLALDSLPHDPVNWGGLVSSASGNIFVVATEYDFNQRASQAAPGDVIVVRNGSYSGWTMTLSRSGTAAAPIVVMAQTPGGVTFSGSASLTVRANHLVIGGFVFSGLTKQNAIYFQGASNNRFSGNKFYDSGSDPKNRIVGIIDGSNNNRFDHNEMHRNISFGIAVVLPRDSDTSFKYSKNNRFDHNLFRDVAKQSSVQYALPLQIGQYAGSHNVDETNSLIDHNEFINIGTESINSKSNRETIVFNRFVGSAYSSLVLRSGNNKYVDGNYFENVLVGIHAYGENHTIVNNVVVNATDIGLLIPKWGQYETLSGALSTSPSTGNIVVAYNTIVNTAKYAVELGRTWGWVNKEGFQIADNPPFNVKFYNNIFSGGSGQLFADKGSTGTQIRNNLYYASGTATTGTTGADPIIGSPAFVDSYRISTGSVAVNAANLNYVLRRDTLQQNRGSLPDIGAHEAVK